MFKFIALILLLVAANVSLAQERRDDTDLSQATPGNCEMNAALLDSARIEALERTSDDGFVIVIARLGDREISRDRNRRRLLIVKNYLSKNDLPAKMIITAEGERVSGYGRVELYVGGKLHGVLLANRNKLLCVECCDPDDEDFYPYRKRAR